MTMPAVSRKTVAAKVGPDSSRSIILHGITWDAYKAICAAVADQRVRMTYERGALEIMVISLVHDNYARLFGLIVFSLARFYRKRVRSCGSFTHQRQDIERGFEPNQCFYLASLAAIKGKKELDLARDPPPDLAVEIDISRSSMDRLAIYAAFGVPEVWRFDSKIIQVYVLKTGTYEAVTASPSFPDAPVAELARFVELGVREDDIAMVEKLEAWLAKLPSGKRKGTKRGTRK
jgi:Uma2 family endonuclease